MNEIIPVLDRASENFLIKLNSDEVDSFEYVRRCWHESMRLQAPFPVSSTHKFIKTVKIKGIEFSPDTLFHINIDAIHSDPKEWIDPERYDPDRFDSNSSMFLRPDGKPRNHFSFCPFFGGKRVCLGKMFAEIMTVYTLPLMMYHFNFEFVIAEHKLKKPNFQLLTPKAPVILMELEQIRFIKL